MIYLKKELEGASGCTVSSHLPAVRLQASLNTRQMTPNNTPSLFLSAVYLWGRADNSGSQQTAVFSDVQWKHGWVFNKVCSLFLEIVEKTPYQYTIRGLRVLRYIFAHLSM